MTRATSVKEERECGHETEELTKTYGKNRDILDVDLTVNEGEVFGFLGHRERDRLGELRRHDARALLLVLLGALAFCRRDIYT